MQAAMKANPKRSFEAHWEGLKVAMVRMARAHCQLVLVDNFYRSLSRMEDDGESLEVDPSSAGAAHTSSSVSAEVRNGDANGGAAANPMPAVPNTSGAHAQLVTALHPLADLFAISLMEQHLGDFVEDGYLSIAQTTLLRQRSLHLLTVIRPNAVALCDAFDHTDFALNSALGRYDGDVYGCMYEWAKRNPLNQPGGGPDVKVSLLPTLHGTINSKL
jgi:hypothetical protein